jgi:hypothetical protein
MTFCEPEELGPWGPVLVSTLPTISMNVNMKRRNTAFTFGFKLWRQRSAAKRNEQRRDERIDECDIFLESFSNIIQRKDRTNAGGGLLIYAKDTIHHLSNTR